MFVRALDIGGSEIRVASSKDNVRTHDSIFMEIPVTAQNKDYIEDKKADFIIMESTLPTIVNRRFVRGVAMNHYQGNIIVTDNQRSKVEQDSTYINAIYSLAYELLDSNVTSDDCRVGICIPVMEFYSDRYDYVGMLKANLTGYHVVFFPLLDKTIEIRIAQGHVNALPEGVVAAYGFANNPDFVNAVTLVVDAGYRSTDITILKNFKPLGKGARSLPVGGINLEAILIGELERSGVVVDRENARQAFVSGTVSNGNAPLDVRDAVAIAREKFASDLYNSIVDVLSYNMVNIRSINNILLLGRPFTQSAGSDLGEMLFKFIPTELNPYRPEDLGLANVTETIGVMKRSGVAV